MGGYGEGTYGGGPYGIGSDYEAFVEERILDNFPDLLPKGEGSVFRRYIDAHDEQLTKFDAEISNVVASHYIETAEGADLDRIGKLFGQLGQRSGRDDGAYRSYLKSIVQSFSGRGTVPGIRFAVSGAIGKPPENVEVIEHFDTLENTIYIDDWNEHSNDTIITVFNLAKPSVVQLRDIIIYGLEGASVDVEIKATAGLQEAGLGSGTIGDNSVGFYS